MEIILFYVKKYFTIFYYSMKVKNVIILYYLISLKFRHVALLRAGSDARSKK